MLKRIFLAILVFGLGHAAVCNAQLCVTSHTTDLYCLIPAAFHTRAAPFNAFYTPFGTELSQLPTAKPAGLVLAFDRGRLVPANETLGAIFSERAETIGRGRLLLSFGYQRFRFGSIDGTDLKHIPIVLTFNSQDVSVYTVTNNRFDIKADQYSGLAVYGLTKNIDVSAAIPFERIVMSVGVNGTEYSTQGSTVTFVEYAAGSASGISDAVFGIKWKVLDAFRIRLAPGVDVRVPSGDEINFLGSGTVGVKPYLAASVKGWISAHGNIGYQWNDDSILNPSSQGTKQQLPTNLSYTAGVNADLIKNRLTVIVDLLGQHFIDAPRLTPATTFNGSSIPAVNNALSVGHEIEGYTVNNIAIGAKARPFGKMVLTGNITIKANSAGLRSTVVPMVGLTYSF
jgi:hypothetical protein